MLYSIYTFRIPLGYFPYNEEEYHISYVTENIYRIRVSPSLLFQFIVQERGVEGVCICSPMRIGEMRHHLTALMRFYKETDKMY